MKTSKSRTILLPLIFVTIIATTINLATAADEAPTPTPAPTPKCVAGQKLNSDKTKCLTKPCSEMKCTINNAGTCVEGQNDEPSTCKCKNEFFTQVGEECVHICNTDQHGCRENSKCVKNKENDEFTCPCDEKFVAGKDGICYEELCPFGWHRIIQSGKCVQKTCNEMFPNGCPTDYHECNEPKSNELDMVATCNCKEGYHNETTKGNNICVIDTCESMKVPCKENEVCTESDSEMNIPAKCDCGQEFKPIFPKGTRICVPYEDWEEWTPKPTTDGDGTTGNVTDSDGGQTTTPDGNEVDKCKGCSDGGPELYCRADRDQIKSLKAGLISACVILGIALIIAILVARHYKNKPSSRKGSGTVTVTSSTAVPLGVSTVGGGGSNNNKPPEYRPHDDTHV